MAGKREQFGSRLGFILAAAGSAVGIGNLVGFPVGAAKNGGGAFLFMYALFVFFICLPIMMAEMSFGRHTQKDPYGAYKKISNNNLLWKIGGSLSILTPFMIAVFYLVITVWIFGYLAESAMGNLSSLADPAYFGAFINSDKVFLYMIFVLLIMYLILQGGVKKGIELAAKVMMPTLFIMLVGLVLFVLSQDNALAGVQYYVIPDFSKIDANVINGALSQAFFSLSLGMGIMITYGSYLARHEDIVSSAKLVALTDTAVAFIAGLLILPAIFSFNPDIDPESLSTSSVGMIFTFLPKIFLAMQDTIGYGGASTVASIFFLLVFFAAITSQVSIFEVPVSTIISELKLSRKRSLVWGKVLLVILAVACALSFGRVEWLTSFVAYAGVEKSFFDVVIDIFYDTILPINGLLLCIFVSYRWSIKKMQLELSDGNTSYATSLFQRYLDISLRTIIPLLLTLIVINTILQKYFAYSLIG